MTFGQGAVVRIAVVGASGFVGSALCGALSESKHDLVAVTRQNHEEARNYGRYDILINAAMPSKRYWARLKPQADFLETVAKTSRLLNEWDWGRFVQISSVSARTQLDTVYGRHKAAAEKLCSLDNTLILRLGPLYGDGLAKGVLVDMVQQRTVYVDGESRYAFTSVEWVAQNLARRLGDVGMIEVGARGALRLKDVAAAIGSRSEFRGQIDHQEIESDWLPPPAASDVFDFLRRLKERLAKKRPQEK